MKNKHQILGEVLDRISPDAQTLQLYHLADATRSDDNGTYLLAYDVRDDSRTESLTRAEYDALRTFFPESDVSVRYRSCAVTVASLIDVIRAYTIDELLAATA